MNRSKTIFLTFFTLWIFTFSACYTFQDASTEGIHHAHVELFTNQANMVNPMLSQAFTERLKDKIARDTNIKLSEENADVLFRGIITDYSITPLAATADERAALSRFRISVRVEYIDTNDEKNSWTSTFTRFSDFDSNLDFSNVEARLMEEINTQLIDDIFRRAFVNW